MTLLLDRNLAVTIASGDALDIRQLSVHVRMSSVPLGQGRTRGK